MMPVRTHHYPVVVTGMHRSGTSLVASMLSALSIGMGPELLPADSNNVRGYFEDVEFLQLQRTILSSCCASDDGGHPDWGWTENETLDHGCFQRFLPEAKALIASRAELSGPWGWKDPRTSLLLDFWDGLIEDARYILVYRFPWDVADSMQRLGAEVFLKNPEYGYRIWEFYNSRIRDFYVKHSGRCLLISTNALRDNLGRFSSLISGKLGIGIADARLDDIQDTDLLKTTTNRDPLIDLVAAVWPNCAKLLSDLDDLADISAKGLWQAGPVRSRLARPDRTREEGSIDVSVVTPCFNQGVLLVDAIASVERFAPPNCELIIVNDGSHEPRTLEILETLKGCGYFIVDQKNLGLSAARNRAISIARGRYILPLDDDNRIRANFIEDAKRVLDSSPEVGIVYGDRSDFGLYSGAHQIPEFDLTAILEMNYIDACAVFRKAVWEDCGGYDPRMSPMEDWELWIHAAERGWRFHHLHYLAFDYRIRPGSLISGFQSTESLQAFRKRILQKHRALASELLSELTARQAHGDLLSSIFATEQAHADLLSSKLAAERERAQALSVTVEELKEQILEKDEVIQSLGSHASADEREKEALLERLAERDAELAKIKASAGWRLLERYGRIKYGPLLPIYRALGLTPNDLAKRGGSPVSDGVRLAVDGSSVRKPLPQPQELVSLDCSERNVPEQIGPIFYHRPHGQPSHGITDEVIKRFDELCTRIIENPCRIRFSKPDNLTLITYNNYKRRVLIEKCYEAYDIGDYVVLGQEIVEWDWSSKIGPVLTYLESGKCRSEYVVGTDSDDVLMVSDPANIIKLFESYDCDVLFCNTFLNWPPIKEYGEFESLKYYTHQFHSHLSAGGYVARRCALIEFLKEILVALEEKRSWVLDNGVFNDQLAWKHLHHKYYPRIKVDFKSLIFKRYDLFIEYD